jgi:hypothetical protein
MTDFQITIITDTAESLDSTVLPPFAPFFCHQCSSNTRLQNRQVPTHIHARKTFTMRNIGPQSRPIPIMTIFIKLVKQKPHLSKEVCQCHIRRHF